VLSSKYIDKNVLAADGWTSLGKLKGFVPGFLEREAKERELTEFVEKKLTPLGTSAGIAQMASSMKPVDHKSDIWTDTLSHDATEKACNNTQAAHSKVVHKSILCDPIQPNPSAD